MNSLFTRPFVQRIVIWILCATLIFLPLLALKRADPGAWAPGNLGYAFAMLTALALTLELALRVPAQWSYRTGVAIFLSTSLLLIWGNLAVGFAGSEEEVINLVFLFAPALALAGGLAARFRATGLAASTACAAAVQVAAGLLAYAYGYFTAPLTVAFSGLWLASSIAFARASRTISAQDAS